MSQLFTNASLIDWSGFFLAFPFGYDPPAHPSISTSSQALPVLDSFSALCPHFHRSKYLGKSTLALNMYIFSLLEFANQYSEATLYVAFMWYLVLLIILVWLKVRRMCVNCELFCRRGLSTCGFWYWWVVLDLISHGSRGLIIYKGEQDDKPLSIGDRNGCVNRQHSIQWQPEEHRAKDGWSL